jgi:hypothetical protein
MQSVDFIINLLHLIEVHAYTKQLLVEIVFDHTGFSFMLVSYYQFVVFCASFFRVIINILYISIVPFIQDFWLIIPFIGWIVFWYNYIRNLKYIIWLKSLRGKFLSSHFIVHEWPKWRLIIYQYFLYYSSYTRIFKNFVNLQYLSLGIFKKISRTIEFIYTFFLFMPYTFKFGNRKQSYFRNYFNSKRRHNNWIWKWRK